jgi:hypothetical protein
MNAINCLSKIIYLISAMVSSIAFIILPMILEKSSTDDFVTCSLRDTWGEIQTALPIPTKYALFFTDHKVERILIFILLLIAGIVFEIAVKNKLLSGAYHLTYLSLGVILGGSFLFACLLPYFPLGC